MAKKKDPVKPGGDMARKIWLAGIGAYGRAFSEAQESLSRVSDETSKYFDDLVQRGEEIEETVETRGRELARRVAPSNFNMDERIKEMRAKLKRSGIGNALDHHEDESDRLDALSARIDALEEKIDMLIAADKPTAKRKTTKTAKKKSPKKKSG